MRTSRFQRLQEYHRLAIRNANGGLLNRVDFKRYRVLHAEFGQKPHKTDLNALKSVDNQPAELPKNE